MIQDRLRHRARRQRWMPSAPRSASFPAWRPSSIIWIQTAGRFDKQIYPRIGRIHRPADRRPGQRGPTPLGLPAHGIALDGAAGPDSTNQLQGQHQPEPPRRYPKQEAFEDLELNFADIAGSELFKKLYVAEYDQYGGEPYGGIIGSVRVRKYTRTTCCGCGVWARVATAAHAPFVGNMSPQVPRVAKR